MKGNYTKEDKVFLWQVILVWSVVFILLAILIVVAVGMIGKVFVGDAALLGGDEKGNSQIVVPDVSPAKLTDLTAEDFSYDGDYLACTAKAYERGVDVSHYQGEIDWKRVRDAGFTFAIIRIGGRGYGEDGRLYVDESAQVNYEGAKAAGLKVGAYFFSQAITEIEAREEARYALHLVRDWELDLPLVYDWEYISDEARTGNMEESDKIRFTKAFCKVIEDGGVQPMVYVAPWASVDYMLAVEEYPVWLVLYSDQMTFKYHFDYWQYSCTGKVPGISGEVDINLYIPSDN